MITSMSDPVPQRAEIVVDLAAVRHNIRILKDLVSVDGPVQLMAVVKADGYGHGMVEVAAAARDAGADWLGVATIEEALALRGAGDHGAGHDRDRQARADPVRRPGEHVRGGRGVPAHRWDPRHRRDRVGRGAGRPRRRR